MIIRPPQHGQRCAGATFSASPSTCRRNARFPPFATIQWSSDECVLGRVVRFLARAGRFGLRRSAVVGATGKERQNRTFSSIPGIKASANSVALSHPASCPRAWQNVLPARQRVHRRAGYRHDHGRKVADSNLLACKWNRRFPPE
jgi:hypothetical protein